MIINFEFTFQIEKKTGLKKFLDYFEKFKQPK